MTVIKYTKDGKKVAVLGKLNSEESIVQEIFVSDGQEIPGGENFVAKGLLDQPAESWKEKRTREIEQAYERRMADLNNGRTEAECRLQRATQKAKIKADALMAFAENSEDAQLDRMRSFMAGEITHLWIGGHEKKLVEFDSDRTYQIESFGSFDRRKIEGIKLFCLFGSSSGNLQFKMNRFRDGSGAWDDIIPCRSYEEALSHAQAQLDHESEKFLSNNNATWFNIKEWRAIDGIKIPKAVTHKQSQLAEKARLAKIEKLKAELAELEL